MKKNLTFGLQKIALNCWWQNLLDSHRCVSHMAIPRLYAEGEDKSQHKILNISSKQVIHGLAVLQSVIRVATSKSRM